MNENTICEEKNDVETIKTETDIPDGDTENATLSKTLEEQVLCATGIKEENEPPSTVIEVSNAINAAATNVKVTKATPKKRHNMSSSSALEALKRRKIKVAGAPKLPLTGYVRYMNDRREQLKRELPNKTALEHTRIIAEEWQQLADERKAPYLGAAEIEKQRYVDELNKFLKEHPEILANEMAKNQTMQRNKMNKKANEKASIPAAAAPTTAVVNTTIKENPIVPATTLDIAKQPQMSQIILPEDDLDELPLAASMRQAAAVAAAALATAATVQKRTPTPTIPTATTTVNNHVPPTNNHTGYTPGEIPIFTNEFLEHNKNFDLDFRTLRKQRADIEQQNAVLDMHVENTRAGLKKIHNESKELELQNHQLSLYLQQTKQKLIGAFSALVIPNAGAANDANIDEFMHELYGMANTPNSHVPVLNKARDIIRKLELPVRPKY